MAHSDQELLKLLSADNSHAFEKLYGRHWEIMYKTAFAILHDTEASKDIVQDIFIWLWEHRQSLQIISLKSYLKTAVKFKVANYIRSGNIRETFFREVIVREFRPEAATLVEQLEVKQLKTIIQEVISRLPEKCKQIFQLSRDGNLSNQEIARQLNISVKTVERQMTIAISRIRKAAGPHIATASSLLLFCLHEALRKIF